LKNVKTQAAYFCAWWCFYKTKDLLGE